jgi:hypothetical protein
MAKYRWTWEEAKQGSAAPLSPGPEVYEDDFDGPANSFFDAVWAEIAAKASRGQGPSPARVIVTVWRVDD